MNSEVRLIRFSEVEKLTGLPRSSIYKKIKEKDFPEPIKIGERITAFVEKEVIGWIEQKIQDSRPEMGAQ